MKMKKKTKILLIIAILIAIIILPKGEVQAALQANPNTHYKKTDTPVNWMANIRAMEATGGAMGLNETINATTKVGTSESNGIDVHMMKSTEYGAIAILSASGYGNPQTLQASSVKTTTGNKSGVYFSGTAWEFVAGGLSGYVYSGVDGRYYDTYTTANTSARVGDGLGSSTTANPGLAGWHSASYSDWVITSYPYFLRGNGGLFSFSRANASFSYYARGVAVVGVGL